MELFKKSNKKTKFFIILNIIFGLLYLFLQIWISSYYFNLVPILLTIFDFVILFSYFFASFLAFRKFVNYDIVNEKLQKSEDYNKSLKDMNDNVRCFKHNYNNTVTTISGYLQTDDLKGLKSYFSHLEKDCKTVNDLGTLDPEVINNPGIYHLISSKYYQATEDDIDFSISFFMDLTKININIYEFSKILGILLDNAIEAARESDKKIINLTFRREFNKHRDIVLIENSYKNKDINIDDIYKKGYSEKENHTGLGLWEIHKYLSRHNNLNLYTTKNKDFFSQQFEIYFD